jgi:hypothetical protein
MHTEGSQLMIAYLVPQVLAIVADGIIRVREDAKQSQDGFRVFA